MDIFQAQNTSYMRHLLLCVQRRFAVPRSNLEGTKHPDQKAHVSALFSIGDILIGMTNDT